MACQSHVFVSILFTPIIFFIFVATSESTIQEVKSECGKIPKLEVSFCPETKNDVTCGERYTDSTAERPRVTFSAAEHSKEYTLLMVDPDAPSAQNPRARYWLHWLVVNVPGSVLKIGGDIPDGPPIKGKYEGPSPPVGSGPHRYYFFLYEQEEHFGEDAISSPASRASFDVAKFALDHQLKDPVAMNMFTTERK